MIFLKLLADIVKIITNITIINVNSENSGTGLGSPVPLKLRRTALKPKSSNSSSDIVSQFVPLVTCIVSSP